MPNWIKPNAPRFHALLEHNERRSVFLMRRSSWESFKLSAGSPVILTAHDLADTPLARPPAFLFAAGSQTRERCEIAVYRADLKDAPNLINVDTYEVWPHLARRVDVRHMVNAATTGFDANFATYTDAHVFLVKDRPGFGHRIPSLPEEVIAVLKRLELNTSSG